ncbi:MAG: hypothetical protein L0312_10085, partial [Acidobacteria bacterium]|nr:hypothetical protein [Acidobacteriota bacterium]
IVVRISDGASSRCVNLATDRVWLLLRRLVTNKEKGWFTDDRSVGVLVNTTLEGYTGSKTEKRVFPRMVESRIEDYESGNGVSIPIEFGILNSFLLRNGPDTYSSAEFDFAIVRKKKRTTWGHVLDALVSVTKKLPLPASPFTDGFGYFAEYANSAVERSIREESNAQNVIPQARIAQVFSLNGQCIQGDDFARTGTLAVIQAAAGSEDQGYVDIARHDRYNFKADAQPVFSLRFCIKNQNGQCPGNYRLVQNDYAAFFLNAVSEVSGGPQLREESAPRESPRPLTFSREAVDGALFTYAWHARSASIDSWAAFDDLHFFARGRLLGGEEPTPLAMDINGALSQPVERGKVPFGTIVHGTGDTLVWRLTQRQALAADLAQSLRRCSVHGVEPEDCFRRWFPELPTEPK